MEWDGRFWGKKEISGPLLQQIPSQTPGAQHLRHLVILLSSAPLCSFLPYPRDESSCRGITLLWVANVCSFHIAPSQEELIDAEPHCYLLLWLQEPSCEVTIRGTSWEQPSRAYPGVTRWWGRGLPVGYLCVACRRAVGKLLGR